MTVGAVPFRLLRAVALPTGLLALAVGLPPDDQVVGLVGESVEGSLGTHRVGEGGEPLVWTPLLVTTVDTSREAGRRAVPVEKRGRDSLRAVSENLRRATKS